MRTYTSQRRWRRRAKTWRRCSISRRRCACSRTPQTFALNISGSNHRSIGVRPMSWRRNMAATPMLLLVARLRHRRGLERFAVWAFAELFDLFFGLRQDGAAVLDEELAALVFDERFLQRHFAA